MGNVERIAESRPFILYRTEDETGVSGTGIVAQGVVFGDGIAVMHWVVEPRSTAVFASMFDLLSIHGHLGKTVIQWLPYNKDGQQ